MNEASDDEEMKRVPFWGDNAPAESGFGVPKRPLIDGGSEGLSPKSCLRPEKPLNSSILKNSYLSLSLENDPFGHETEKEVSQK